MDGKINCVNEFLDLYATFLVYPSSKVSVIFEETEPSESVGEELMIQRSVHALSEPPVSASTNRFDHYQW